MNPYNPFIGGFVHEYIDKGTFKRFKNTKAKIYELQVEEEQYQKMEQTIAEFEKNKQNYKFNIIGLFSAGFNIRITRENSYYCAEFVKHVIETAGIETGLPEIIKPEHFKNLEGLKEIYSGKLKEYKRPKVVNILKKILTYPKKEGIA